MILSMTGYGSARHAENGVAHELEVRSVNNRYLKLAIKLPEHLQFAESEIDKLLRSRLARGSVTLTLRLRGEALTAAPLDTHLLQQYVNLLSQVRLPGGVQPVVDLAAVAALPGVTGPVNLDDQARQKALHMMTELANRGLDSLLAMRREEGRLLHDDLTTCCDAVRRKLAVVADRAPTVIHEYRDRLQTRVAALMQSGGFELEADALAREVALFAERCDISEEIQRLNSHLDQFHELCGRGEQVGRTMDFLAQEMLREANTIGSKSNDAAIARNVVEIKGLIDRLKEQVQNVE
jgi:uncharacterized protein (TIGR00255 family)